MLAFFLAALALLPLTGGQAMVVTGGSMAPSINAGDVVVLAKVAAHEVREGDVITFQGYRTPALTTHRVVSIKNLPTGRHYQTKGDANDTTDPNLAPGQGLRGRVAVTFPGLGRAAMLLQDRWTRLLLLGGPSVFWIIRSLSEIVGDPAKTRLTSRLFRTPSRARTWIAVMAVTASCLSVGAIIAKTSATYIDVLPVGDNSFSTMSAF